MPRFFIVVILQPRRLVSASFLHRFLIVGRIAPKRRFDRQILPCVIKKGLRKPDKPENFTRVAPQYRERLRLQYRRQAATQPKGFKKL
ncbi:hypothetical protein THS27_19475 [Thalassospira sp. MCCC 1A01428]|nr:hypothetical protein THS27_19475 [Thalassospira sp. MCCC 1A01428]